MALPWLFTHSRHQPLPHCVQTPCDGIAVCVVQRRQAVLAPARGRCARGAGETLACAPARGGRAGVAWRDPAAGVVAVDVTRGTDGVGASEATGASDKDASATTKTVPQPEQRALSPGTSSFSGGTRIARRHFGHSTVTLRL
jgi:hypothetical protein